MHDIACYIHNYTKSSKIYCSKILVKYKPHGSNKGASQVPYRRTVKHRAAKITCQNIANSAAINGLPVPQIKIPIYIGFSSPQKIPHNYSA